MMSQDFPRPVRVLAVDDEPINLMVLEAMLDSPGFALSFCGDGLEAWERLDQAAASVDVVLLDLMMPVMSGEELLQKLRADERFRHLPIIIMTARSGLESRAFCLGAGANAYLTKPFDADDLMEEIERHVQPRVT